MAEEDQWERLLDLMGNPEWGGWEIFQNGIERAKNQDVLNMYLDEWFKEQKVDELERLLTEWTSRRARWEATKILQAASVAAFPSLSATDLAEDQNLEARGVFSRLEHPEVGARQHIGISWLLAESPNGVRSPAPLLGQHTDEVMRDVLGYTPEEIARLKEEKMLD